MTGPLDMGNNKLTNLGNPENGKDAVNKKYVDNFLEHHEHDLDLDVIGRYLVISKNGNKNYVSLRTKKNIDLSNAVANITADNLESLYHRIITILPNGNNLGIMQLNNLLTISVTDTNDLPEPWTFLFSAKIEELLLINNSALIFTTANQTLMFIYMVRSSGTFKYAVTDTVMTNQNATLIGIDTTQFNHIDFEYILEINLLFGLMVNQENHIT